MEPIEEIITIRKKKIEELMKRNIEPYPKKYGFTHYISEIRDKFNNLQSDTKTDYMVRICGRVMSRRHMGKATFLDIQDSTGKIQIYLRSEIVGNDKYEDFLSFVDIGDYIGVEGKVFTTKTGELSINVEFWTLLSKSLRPLPEKWHGLKDVEVRYRQRYLDLISNPEVKDVFIKRSKIINYIREFLNNNGFIEVETPILQNLAGGALARPFSTYHGALDMNLYLRIAPEIFLKMLVIGGMERIYEIGKSFRNEGIDRKHNPEFTMLEVYQAYADYSDMMNLCERMITYVMEKLDVNKIVYENYTLNFPMSFKRVSLDELIKERFKIGLRDLLSEEAIYDVAKKEGIEPAETIKKTFERIFSNLIQQNLIEPTFVYDYPVAFSPLAKRKDDFFAERFELFIATEEIANAYSELNDPQEQLERFKIQQKERLTGDEEAHAMDLDFITSLEYGMPPCAGLGIGIDRLVMVLTGMSSIREVISFPLLKPVKIDKGT